MSYLIPVQESLQQAFTLQNMHLRAESDYIVVENSSTCTEEKIRSIIASAGFCPFVYQNHSSKDFAFTVLPYKLPDSFSLRSEQKQAPYFSLDELSKLLSPKAFIGEGADCRDPWSAINRIREIISPALDKALFEILDPLLRDRDFMVEIGAGKGYTLPVSSKAVRIQPGLAECQLLRKATTAPIYQLNIEELDKELCKIGKKVPLFVGIDFFDTTSREEREANLRIISSHQNPGDMIESIHDVNPHANGMIEYLEKEHPGYVVLPYYPLEYHTCAPFSIILVPKDRWMLPSDLLTFKLLQQDAANKLSEGRVAGTQLILHQLKEELDLQVISLEEAYVNLVESELERVGYTVQSRYYAAFTTIDEKKVPRELADFDFYYKPVTDIGMIRSWYINDQVIRKSISDKKIPLPPEYFDEANFKKLRAQHQKFMGAEIIEIKATKKPL